MSLTVDADVALKERRRVVLMRETLLHIGHIRSMAAVTEMGAIIYPPVPAFYAMPKSLDEMVDHTLGSVLDLFEMDSVPSRDGQGARRVRKPHRFDSDDGVVIAA